jgi:hypothetical protein
MEFAAVEMAKPFVFVQKEILPVNSAKYVSFHIMWLVLILGVRGRVMPLSTIFQLYHDGLLYRLRKPEYPEKVTDLS